MLSRASIRSFPPSRITFSARRHAFQASLVFPYHLAAHREPLGADSVIASYFWHFEASFKESQALYTQSIT